MRPRRAGAGRAPVAATPDGEPDADRVQLWRRHLDRPARGRGRASHGGEGTATDPSFSPDGSLIAFTGDYDGNADVYVVAASGGVPHRLTYHPAPDDVVGWTPDGSRILFRSTRNSYSRYSRLFTVSKDGGPATEVDLPRSYAGSYSADGKRLAYMPSDPANEIWKRYRGGEASEIWLATLSDASIERVPRDGSNDASPMWIGNSVYFLSDRNGPTSLFKYDTQSKQVTQVVENHGLDIKSASAGPDAIVYEQFGALYLFDPGTQKSAPVPVTVSADLPKVRPHFVPAGDRSPTRTCRRRARGRCSRRAARSSPCQPKRVTRAI